MNIRALLQTTRLSQLGKLARRELGHALGHGTVWFLHRAGPATMRLTTFARGGMAAEIFKHAPEPSAGLESTSFCFDPNPSVSDPEQIVKRLLRGSVGLVTTVGLGNEWIGWWGISHSGIRDFSALSAFFELVAARTAQMAQLDQTQLENTALRLMTARGDQTLWLLDEKAEILAATPAGTVLWDTHFRRAQLPQSLVHALLAPKKTARLTPLATALISPVEPSRGSLASPLFLVEILTEPATAKKFYLHVLSRAERAVHSLLCDGKTNAEIAGLLGKAELTVQNQVHAILRKTGARDRRELMLQTLARGSAVAAFPARAKGGRADFRDPA